MESIPRSKASFPLQDGNSVKPLLCTAAHISAVSVLHGICLAAAVNSLFCLFYSVVELGRYLLLC